MINLTCKTFLILSLVFLFSCGESQELRIVKHEINKMMIESSALKVEVALKIHDNEWETNEDINLDSAWILQSL